jgi:hypothetical protein
MSKGENLSELDRMIGEWPAETLSSLSGSWHGRMPRRARDGPAATGAGSKSSDQSLSPGETARRLRLSKEWIYRRRSGGTAGVRFRAG